MTEHWLRKCVYGLRDKRSLVLGLVVVMMIALVDCVNGGREGTSQFRIYSTMLNIRFCSQVGRGFGRAKYRIYGQT